MNEQTLNRITKEAEEKYPMTFYDGTITLDDKLFEVKREAYIAGATPYAERSEKLRECLQQCVEVMQVLEDAGFLKVIENDNILDKSKQALNNNL